MRAVFATDMFSLMLLLRLTDRADIHTRTVQWLSAVILVVYAVFYGWILYDSNIKWNIYKNTLSQYLDQPGNTVRIDDYQSKIGLIEYYTVNLDNIFMPGDKASTLAAMKYRKQGKRVGEDGPDERDYIKILPENVFQQAIANGPTFFIEARRTPGIGFYRDLQLVYDIMPYDAEILRRINEGYFYAVYRLPMMNNVRLKINYLHDDTAFERAAFDVDVPLYGRYILLNRKFKHYPLLQFEWFGMNEEVPDAKIEILR